MPNHLAKPPKHLLRTHPQLQTERFLSERAESRTPGRPRAAKRVFNGVAREPCLVVDATTCFPAPAPRHGSASRPPAPDRTPRDAVRGHVAPPAARGDLVPVLRSQLLLSLKTPLFAASPLSLSPLPSLPCRLGVHAVVSGCGGEAGSYSPPRRRLVVGQVIKPAAPAPYPPPAWISALEKFQIQGRVVRKIATIRAVSDGCE